MAEIHLQQYFATLRVHLAEEVVLQHSPSSPAVIGVALAEQIHDYVKQQQMGYYPALAYFEMLGEEGRDSIEQDLMDAAESMSWLLCRLVRNEIQTQLRQVFSSVKFHSLQTMAYNMPLVRYGSNNALYNLALHYTPLSVKLDLELSMISKQQSADGMEEFIGNALYRLLNDSFESLEISSVVKMVSDAT